MFNPDDRSAFDIKFPARRQPGAKSHETRPVGQPNAKKDFKKVYSEKDDGFSANDVDDKKEKVEPEDDVALQAENVASADAESPSALFQRLTNAKRQAQAGQGAVATNPKGLAEAAAPAQPLPRRDALARLDGNGAEALAVGKEEKTTIPKKGEAFREIQPDMNSVRPTIVVSALDVPAVNAKAEVTPTMSTADRVAKIEELLNTIVDKIETFKHNGITETEVSLRNIKNFEGAKLVLTNYDSDTKSFNISFTNLNAIAKSMIDAGAADLRRMLETKHGLTVHIIVATTENEKIITTNSASETQRERGGQPGDGRREKRDQRGQQGQA